MKFDIMTDGLRKVLPELDMQNERLGNDISRLIRVNSMIKGNPTLDICKQTIEQEVSSVRRIQQKVGTYRNVLDQVIRKYEACENNIISNMNGHMLFSLNENNKAYSGSSKSETVLQENKETDYSGWGIEPGTIQPVEYAYLAKFCNEASEMGSLEEMAKSFERNLKSLPEGHPLRNAKFYSCRGGTNDSLDAFIIEIDPDHAIVVFGGTTQCDDAFTDVGLVADSTAGLNILSAANHIVNPMEHLTQSQFEAANEVIKDVSKKYKDIKVTGHSLGGHIAVDVTLNNDCISECVTFDPPGRGDAWRRNTFDPRHRTDKITNYTCKGSNVSSVGEQVGHTIEIEVKESNIQLLGDIAGFTNHKIENIIDYFGGMNTKPQVTTYIPETGYISTEYR